MFDGNWTNNCINTLSPKDDDEGMIHEHWISLNGLKFAGPVVQKERHEAAEGCQCFPGHCLVLKLPLALPTVLCHSAVASTKVSYGQMVRDRGFYLGLMDIALLVSERAKDKTVMMLFYDDENRNQIISLYDVLKELWPSCPEMPLQKPAGGGFDKDTWFFISCNADWHRVADEHLNHWVPAWHSQQLGADYEVLKCQARHDLAKHALGILESMKGEDSNEFDLDAMMPSLLDQQGTIQRQQAFYEDMFRASLFPQMVPGDGSCAMWTWLAVSRGWPRNENTHVAPIKTMLDLRADTCIHLTRKSLSTLYYSISIYITYMYIYIYAFCFYCIITIYQDGLLVLYFYVL